MRRSNYSEEEVRAIIESYEELLSQRDTTPRGIRYIIAIADIGAALEQLPQDWWEVMLVHGLLGVPQVETARFLQISQQAVNKRFRKAIEEVHYLINGGE